MMYRGICASLMLLVVLGCGGSDKAKLAPVSGTVTYKDAPLKNGSITFLPESGRSAGGKIVDGQITEVTTYDIGDGSPIGTHKVIITSVESKGEGTQAVTKSLIPAKYGDRVKSGLTATIEAGKKNVVDFKLTD